MNVRIPWYVWVLLVLAGAGGLFGAGYFVGKTGEEMKAAQARLVLAEVKIAAKHRLDSMRVAGEAKEMQARTDSSRAAESDRRVTRIGIANAALEDSLDQAVAQADEARQLALSPRVIEGLRVERDSLRQAGHDWRTALESEKAVSATLRARMELDEMVLEEIWTITADGRAAVPSDKPGRSRLRTLETVAIGVVTASACEQGWRSIGCIAGAVTLIPRILKK